MSNLKETAEKPKIVPRPSNHLTVRNTKGPKNPYSHEWMNERMNEKFLLENQFI